MLLNIFLLSFFLKSLSNKLSLPKEYAWTAWLTASVELDVLKDYKLEARSDREIDEQNLVKELYVCVLCHYVHSMKGGWQQLEETADFLLLCCQKVCLNFK